MLVPFSRQTAIGFLLILLPLAWLAYLMGGWEAVSLLGFLVAGWLMLVSLTWLFSSIYTKPEEVESPEDE